MMDNLNLICAILRAAGIVSNIRNEIWRRNGMTMNSLRWVSIWRSILGNINYSNFLGGGGGEGSIETNRGGDT